jgi:enediyne biosynthesis protein E5
MSTNLWNSSIRNKALIRFALALSTLNILGYSFLGFEPAIITPFFAISVAITAQLFIEFSQSLVTNTKPEIFNLSYQEKIVYFLPAYISALAISMLLFSNGSLYEIAFATCLAIASKFVFVAPANPSSVKHQSPKHFMNPSNLGISVTLILFPWIGISPPYQFTEHISGVWDVFLILLLFVSGSLLNTLLTKRVFLIIIWFGAFAGQALFRSWINDTPWIAGLVPMTGLAFILFSFYMITDPPTTPSSKKGQALFAISNAFIYAIFMELHIVFGMFYALTLTSAGRGVYLWWVYIKGRDQSLLVTTRSSL